MTRPRQFLIEWARWLVSKDLPRAHICALIEIDLVKLDELLSFQARRPPAGPPRRYLGRSLRGPTGTKVRRLTELGYEPRRIAEVLALRVAEVRDFLKRTTPVRRPKNGTAELTRPRSRPEQKRLKRRRPPAPEPVDDGWGYRHITARADALVRVEPVEVLGDVAELPAAPPPPATSADEWEPNFGRVEARGRRSGRAMLDDEQAAEVRELRAQGLQRDELAAMFEVSVATITRITSGRSYIDPPPPAVADAELVTVEPQIVAELPAAEPSEARGATPPEWRYFGGRPPLPRRRRTDPTSE